MISRINPVQKECQSLIIDQTPKTPQIELNQLTGELIFSGKSIPENAAKIYEPVLNWVVKYILNPRPVTNLRLSLKYFNAATSLWLANIIKELIRINEPDYVLFIHLYLPVEEFDEMKDFDYINDAFIPVTDIISGAIPRIGIKIYGTNEKDAIIEDTPIFVEHEQFTKFIYT